jgi:hypothetical protein
LKKSIYRKERIERKERTTFHPRHSRESGNPGKMFSQRRKQNVFLDAKVGKCKGWKNLMFGRAGFPLSRE